MAQFVFFDYFGTLVDYDPSIHPPVNAPWAFAQRMGSDLEEQEVSARWQQAWDELDAVAERTGREFSMDEVALRFWRLVDAPELPPGALDTLVTEYLDAWSAGVAPAAGALDCIADLSFDHRLVVVSNTHSATLVYDLVRRFGMAADVTSVITSVDIGWRKPHPGIYDAALAAVGAAPEDVVFVGDNWTADVEGPRAAGMTGLYVGRPEGDRPSVSLRDVPHLIRAR